MIEPLDIGAPAEQVWRLLRDEAQTGVDGGRATVLAEARARELLIEVRMGVGFRVQHAYRLERRGEHCQISARVRPLGWRWRLSNIFLFGRGIRAIEAVTFEGLRNLKAAAEEQSATPR